MQQQAEIMPADKWLAIEAQSHQIYTKAAQGLWQDAMELYLQRQSLLEEFFTAGFAAADAVWVESGIRQLISCDRALKLLAENSRDAMAVEFRNLNQTERAARAYHSTSKY